MDMNSMWQGFDQTQMGGVGIYGEPGRYIFQIQEVKLGTAPTGGYPFVAAPLKVMWTNQPKRPTNSLLEYMVAFKEQQYLQTYQRDVKKFLYAAWVSKDPSVQEHQINMQVLQRTVAQDQPLRSVLILASLTQEPQKKNPQKPWTRWVFTPYSEAAGQAFMADPTPPPPPFVPQVGGMPATWGMGGGGAPMGMPGPFGFGAPQPGFPQGGFTPQMAQQPPFQGAPQPQQGFYPPQPQPQQGAPQAGFFPQQGAPQFQPQPQPQQGAPQAGFFPQQGAPQFQPQPQQGAPQQQGALPQQGFYGQQ